MNMKEFIEKMHSNADRWFFCTVTLCIILVFIMISGHYLVESYKEILEHKKEPTIIECGPPIIYGNIK